MTARFGDHYVGVLDGTVKPPVKSDGRRIKAGVGAISQVVTLAAQASGDTILAFRRPAGTVPLRITLTSSVSLATATVAIGIAGAVEKYRSAAVFTAVDTPTDVMKAAAAAAVPSADEEDIILTIGTAALPASGTLVASLEYTQAAG